MHNGIHRSSWHGYSMELPLAAVLVEGIIFDYIFTTGWLGTK